MGVRVEMPSNQPIVLLKELDGVRYLPIWLGAVEATAIAFAQQEVSPPRPLTHDLFKDVLMQLGAKLDNVYLTELKDGVFYAQLNFEEGPAISARPSDAAMMAKVVEPIPTTPAARPSMPSVKLMMFTMATNQMTVST